MDNERSAIFGYLDQDKEKVRTSRVPLALIVAAAVVVILAGIQAASVIVGPLLLALFIAVILLVPLRWLQERGCPILLAYPIVLFCTIALFVGITYFVYQSLDGFLRQIPEQHNQFVERFAELEEQFEEWVKRFGVGVLREGEEPADDEKPAEESMPVAPEPAEPALAPPPVVPAPEAIGEGDAGENGGEENGNGEGGTDPEADEHAGAGQPPANPLDDVRVMVRALEQDALPFNFEPRTIAAWLARGGLYVQSVLFGGFLVLLFTIFMLFEAANFPKKVNRAFGTDGPINFDHFHKIAEEVRRYLFLKTLSSLMSAVAAAAVYWYFEVPGWQFWGLVAFFMYFIPNLGGTLAAIIPGVLIFIAGGIWVTLAYAVVLLTVECAIAYGIEPKLLGHGMRLSVLVIILSLFFWGFLLGPIGLFLAAPLAVVIKIVLQAFPETRWLAIFLDSGREK